MPDAPQPRDSSSGPLRPSSLARPPQAPGQLPPSNPPIPQKGESGGVFLPPPLVDVNGRTLGQYKLLEKIGQGGMGMVFHAFDTALERTVALKVLFINPLDDARPAERFIREARSMARLNHPNLLHVYNVGSETDCYYFAMELLQGQTLSSAVRTHGKIPADEFVPILGQILSALHYVHEQGITHRDIKSGNIMLCEGRAVLMDFGLAKDEHFSGLTSVGAVMGTPDYMSPESAEGLSEGPPTDIYSLGVVTFEAICGRLPFLGRSALSIIRQHIDTPPPALGEFNPHVDPLLAGIVHKMLQKNPGDRYPHCPALAADLIRYMVTPELTMLVQRKGLIAARPVRGTGTFQPITGPHTPISRGAGIPPARPSDSRNEAADLATIADDAEVIEGGGTIADGVVQPPPGFADAATVVQSNPILPVQKKGKPASRRALEPKPESGWPWWISGAAGFFGVLLTVFIIAAIAHNKKPVDIPPWSGQAATHKKTDGSSEEIRWIEFKGNDPDPSKWTDTIERKQADGTWVRSSVPHSQFAGKNDTLEFSSDKK